MWRRSNGPHFLGEPRRDPEARQTGAGWAPESLGKVQPARVGRGRGAWLGVGWVASVSREGRV